MFSVIIIIDTMDVLGPQGRFGYLAAEFGRGSWLLSVSIHGVCFAIACATPRHALQFSLKEKNLLWRNFAWLDALSILRTTTPCEHVLGKL